MMGVSGMQARSEYADEDFDMKSIASSVSTMTKKQRPNMALTRANHLAESLICALFADSRMMDAFEDAGQQMKVQADAYDCLKTLDGTFDGIDTSWGMDGAHGAHLKKMDEWRTSC